MPATQGELFFNPWQGSIITSWQSALLRINETIAIAKERVDRDLAWRGVVDATYSLHSSLYRRLLTIQAVPPSELDLVAFEKRMLNQSRKSWRFDDRAALETMAHIQHYGGPTRLLDVTFNPLIALWFAVEQQYNQDGSKKADIDGRIFIFDVTNRHIQLDRQWGQRELPWESLASANQKEWKQKLPRVWRPPSYNERIPAQNSAFLIGGVPTVTRGGNAKYRKGPGNGQEMGTWTIDEVRNSSSVTLSMSSTANRPQVRSTPTYTLRISKNCKQEIRDHLEKSYGFNASTIYPDLYGLATHFANRL